MLIDWTGVEFGLIGLVVAAACAVWGFHRWDPSKPGDEGMMLGIPVLSGVIGGSVAGILQLIFG